MKYLLPLTIIVLLTGLFVTGCQEEEYSYKEQPLGRAQLNFPDSPNGCAEEPKKKMAYTQPKTQQKKQPMTNPCQAAASMRKTSATSIPANAVRIEKMAPEQVSKNQKFTYRMKVVNTSSQTLQNINISDQLPDNMELVSSSPSHQMKGQTAHWHFDQLGSNESEMITVKAKATSGQSINTCAHVTYDAPMCAQIAIVEPKLRLVKVAPDQSLSCDRIPIKYVVKNTGTGYACDVTIADQLPDGMMTGQNHNKVTFNIDSLAPDQSKQFEVMVDAQGPGTYSSKAMAMSGNSGQVESNAPQTMVSEPALKLTSSAPSRQYLGRTVTYNYTVHNNGNGPANDTKLVVNVPSGIKFQRATMGGKYTHSSPGKVTWDLGKIQPDGKQQVQMTLSYEHEGQLQTNALATAHCAEDATAQTSTDFEGIPAILLEVIDLNDPVEVGDNVTYKITVTNQGSTDAKDIAVKCMVPQSMKYVSASGATSAMSTGQDISFSKLSTLAPGKQAAWMVKLQASQEGIANFETHVTSQHFQTAIRETEATNLFKIQMQ
jgi:uncharacterized repeat protein (TIGR01451 family)